MDIEVILDTAESEAPGLRELARHFLEAEAAHYGMPLDLASVMARRAEGEPELHVTGAADELVRHLAAGPDALGGYSPLTGPARADVSPQPYGGARSLGSRTHELPGSTRTPATDARRSSSATKPYSHYHPSRWTGRDR